MENLFHWYSFALSLSDRKKALKRELEQASQLILEIEDSLTSRREGLLALLTQDNVTLEDIQQQERHLLLIGRLLMRKRSALLVTAGEHCLKYIRGVQVRFSDRRNFISPKETMDIKEKLEKGLEYLIEEEDLPKCSRKAKLNSEMLRVTAEIFELMKSSELYAGDQASPHEQEKVF